MSHVQLADSLGADPHEIEAWDPQGD
jgi:hypothetical protein